EVFINGQSIGKRPNGYISFNYDITPYIKYGEENTIAVKVDHSQDADSRWYTGSGIYRDVWLVRANPIHIEQWGVYAYPEVKNNQGTLHVQTAVQNETGQTASLSVLTELLDPQDQVVTKTITKSSIATGANNEFKNTLNLTYPKLWNLNAPQLYTLRHRFLLCINQIIASEVKSGFSTL